jgi:hypothetical protein
MVYIDIHCASPHHKQHQKKEAGGRHVLSLLFVLYPLLVEERVHPIGMDSLSPHRQFLPSTCPSSSQSCGHLKMMSSAAAFAGGKNRVDPFSSSLSKFGM